MSSYFSLRTAPVLSITAEIIFLQIDSISTSFKVFSSGCKTIEIAMDFFPSGISSPSYTSKILTSLINLFSALLTKSIIIFDSIFLSTINAKSLSTF